VKIPKISTITTADQARDLAIEWQQWAGEQNQIGDKPTLSMSDFADWSDFFSKLGKKFNLTEEFSENGII
jgi:hypothetical protein